MRTIDHALHLWIAESLLTGCNPQALIDVLVALDVPKQAAQQAVTAAPSHPYFAAAANISIKLQKRDSLLNTLDFYHRLDPDYLKIVPQELPPFADFVRDYLSKNRPGLFKGAVEHWPAMQWTPRSLVDVIGADTIVEIQQGRDATGDYELESANLKRNTRFGDFVERVEHEETNDCYLTANNLALVSNPFRPLTQDVGTLGDGYLEGDRIDYRMFLWLGPKGTVTPLHHDKSNNVFIQIYGRKRFRLIPAIEVPYMYNHLGVFTPIDFFDPKPEQYPLYQRTGIIDVIVEPGDFLFIPIGWWHHVVAESASISLSFTNIPYANDLLGYPTEG
jgi:ribosomal protein L16 Arg81 hydroxylase